MKRYLIGSGAQPEPSSPGIRSRHLSSIECAPLTLPAPTELADSAVPHEGVLLFGRWRTD